MFRNKNQKAADFANKEAAKQGQIYQQELQKITTAIVEAVGKLEDRVKRIELVIDIEEETEDDKSDTEGSDGGCKDSVETVDIETV